MNEHHPSLNEIDSLPVPLLAGIMAYSQSYGRFIQRDDLLVLEEDECPLPGCTEKGTFTINETQKRFSCSACGRSGGPLELVIALNGITSQTSAELKLRSIAMGMAHTTYLIKNKSASPFKPGWYYFQKSDGTYALVNLITKVNISVDGETRPYLVCEGLSNGEITRFALTADEREFAGWSKCKF